MARVITVAVVDDDRMLLDGLRAWLGRVPELRLVATAATVGELLGEPDAQLPYGSGGPGHTPADVVLLDLLLRDGSAPVDNIRRLLRTGSRILMISTVPDRSAIIESIRAGADGYLTKDHDLPTLVAAVKDLAEGRSAHSAELAFACAYDNSPARPSLSPRERQILLDYASGMTLKSAARRAGITVHTAKDYLDRVKAKYQQAGRPTYTKLDLARRVREDSLEAG
ncbi:response regulator [Streptomyces telluris]|uniref:Response regulator transcription factor n=1 Tax=Streptomyces telluris TaxID=2720021 RepID=A0A9X2RP45_9ACTN|nr:response regulator transcription factor [Streptomyces telluris]MCQ8771076.1 response regulator transcription factor [Streptomyces telluris]NJP80550.1 response regulator transcription factor [Streptomyces telluris]